MFKLILFCLVLFIFNPIECSIDCIVKVNSEGFNTTGIFIRNDLLIVLNTFVNKIDSINARTYTFPDICIFDKCMNDFSISNNIEDIRIIKFRSAKHNCSYPTLYPNNTFPNQSYSKTKTCGFDKDNVTCYDLPFYFGNTYGYFENRNAYKYFVKITDKIESGFPIFLNHSNVEYLLAIGEKLNELKVLLGHFINKTQIDDCLSNNKCLTYNFHIASFYYVFLALSGLIILFILAINLIPESFFNYISNCCKDNSIEYVELSNNVK